jgi:hypothetical protein
MRGELPEVFKGRMIGRDDDTIMLHVDAREQKRGNLNLRRFWAL